MRGSVVADFLRLARGMEGRLHVVTCGVPSMDIVTVLRSSMAAGDWLMRHNAHLAEDWGTWTY